MSDLAKRLLAEEGFGAEVNDLARDKGGWPPNAVPFKLEVINGGAAVEITGGVPVGKKADGSPRWDRSKQATYFRAIVSKDEYREASGRVRARIARLAYEKDSAHV